MVRKIKGLRGGIHRYAAQVSLQIDAAMAERTVSGRQLDSNHRARAKL